MPQVFAGLVASLGSAFASTAIGSFLTQTVIGKLLTSVALSALQRALMSKPSMRPPGIKTSATQAGGTNPAQFILGRYATAGYAAAPAMSHGTAPGVVDNAFLTYVIEVSDIPVTGLAGVIIDGSTAEIGVTAHADYGLPILGEFEGKAWIKFYTGSQTTADAMLLDKYGSYPDRPWTSDMIGRGLAYAIFTFQYDRTIFNSLPTVRLIVDGIKLYDPRKDTTAGGSGAHRWSTPATWEFTENPMVQIYNIMRGIALPDGNIWGGSFAAADLPFANWVAAMNACDVSVTEGGASVPLFRAGIEVLVGDRGDEPASVIEELLTACLGQMVDMGGTWKVRVGGPGLPVLFFSDDDLMVTRPEDYDPFPAVTETYNGITATYPEPRSLWEPKEAAPIYRSDWEAEDGQRLVASLQFAAVSSHRQVRHIMRSTLRDHRRARRHNLTLGPSAMALEPLDVVAWTSARNGYTEKSFEVGQVVDDLGGLPVLQVALREVDASDYDPDVFDDATISLPPGKVIRPAARPVIGFSATPYEILDDAGVPRRGAILLTWDTGAVDDVTGIEWEVRRTGTTETVNEGVIRNVASGRKVVTGGVIGGRAYQARVRLVTDRKRSWTAWASVTAPDVRLKPEDLSEEVSTSEAGNAYPDFDMVRPGFYSTNTGADYLFRNTAAALLGSRYLEISTSAAVEQVDTGWFSLEPDTAYLVSAAAWTASGVAGSGTSTVDFQTGSVDTAGVVTPLTTDIVKTRTDSTYNAITSHGNITITSGPTARRGRFRAYRGPGGTAAGRAGGFKCEKMVSNSRISDDAVTVSKIAANQITAAKLNKVDLEAAGVSIFNNNLKSSNYVAGVSGWRLSHGGTLEIRNLIDRSALMADAASDRTQATMLTAMDVPVATNNVILTHSIGAVDFGSYILRAVVFEARNVQAGDTVFDLQIRRKQYGTWGAWEVTSTWTIPGGTTVWDVYSSGNFLTGKYDDVEYRLRSTRSGVASSGIRNLYITTQNTVK